MTLDDLKLAVSEAKLKVQSHPCQETREAYKAAWNALEQATPRRTVSSHASRAGKYQAQARRAMTQR